MKKLEFTSSYGDLLIISENKLSVTNKLWRYIYRLS